MPTFPNVPPELKRRVKNDEKAHAYYKHLVEEMKYTNVRPVSDMVIVACALAYADYWRNPASIEAEKRWQGWELYIVLQKTHKELEYIYSQIG